MVQLRLNELLLQSYRVNNGVTSMEKRFDLTKTPKHQIFSSIEAEPSLC